MTTAFAKLPLLSSRLFVPALLVGALLLPACSKSPAQIEKKDFGLGQHYLSEGKVNEAIIEFQNVLKVNPKSVKGRLGLATAYLRKGWTAESMLEFQEVAKEDPLNLDAHLALARYGVNSGQWNAVKPEIAAVLKIDPNNVEGLSNSGERELALGREKEAEASFKKALTLSPGAVAPLVGMGDLLRHENHPKQAADDYNRALASDPKNARALTGLGSIAQADGKPDEAKDYFRKAIAADKSDLRARIVYANFLAGSGHADQAIALLKAVPQKAADLRIPVKIAEYEVLLGQNAQAIALMHPLELQKIPLPDIYLVLAKAYQGSGRLPEAMEEVTKLSAIDGVPPVMKIVAARVELAGRNPGKAQEILDSIKEVALLPAEYWLTLGEIYSAQGNSKEAQSLIEEGLRKFPGNPRLLLELVDTQVYRKKYIEAKQNLQLLLASNPDNPVYVSRMGILISRTKGGSTGQDYYDNMANKFPDNEALETLYLLSLSASGRVPEAIGKGKEYLKTHSDKQNIRLLIANFELQIGRKDKGIDLFKEVLISDPKNFQALSNLAFLELHSGKFPEAESYYRRALLKSPENADLEAGLGETLLAEKQNRAATEIFKKSLADNPNQPLALLELGRSELLSGNVEGALSHLAPLIKKHFSNKRKAQIQWLWGLANQNAGNLIVALDGFQKAVQLEPNFPVYRETLGEFWASQSMWEQALKEFEKSRTLDPKNSLLDIETGWAKVRSTKGASNEPQLENLVQEASLYRKNHSKNLNAGLIEAQADLLLKKNDQALAVFDSILLTHPGNSQGMLGKANILLTQGHVVQAKKLISNLLLNNPKDIRGNLLMASISQRNYDLSGEAKYLGKVHQLNPTLVQPALLLGMTDLSLRRFEEANSVAFSLYEAHPHLYAALYIKASAEMGLGNYRNAIADFLSLATHDKQPGPIFNLASVAASKAGDRDAAQKYLDLAIKNAPNDPVILNNMAYSLADRNHDLPLALRYAKKALKMVPQPFVQDTIGYVLFRMGSFERAESHFSAAYGADFRDPEFLFHMGMNEWKLGKKDQAESLLRKAVTSGKLNQNEQSEAHQALSKISGA